MFIKYIINTQGNSPNRSNAIRPNSCIVIMFVDAIDESYRKYILHVIDLNFFN